MNSEGEVPISEQEVPAKKSFTDRLRDFFKEKPVPEIALAEIIANPGQFLEAGEFRTSGYVETLDSQTVSWPILHLIPVGKVNIPIMNWITEVTDMHLLHATQTMDDEGLTTVTNNSNYTVGAPIVPPSTEFDQDSQYTFRGKMKKARLEDGTDSVIFKARLI